MEDTIAAISTPPGEGGIGIIRISGKEAVRISLGVFKPRRRKLSSLEPRKVYYGDIFDPDSGEIIDEVILTFMKAPNSYTTQDVVEINCHGGPVVLKRILELVKSHGARIAEPGEFTMRAFLGGRIDLAQAEAVMDIIRARTDESRRVAFSQLKGALSDKINGLREKLIDFLIQLEARIDFCEDDIPPLDPDYKIGAVEEVLNSAKEILESFSTGKIYREGLRVCIAGPTNVGKSTLLNTLVGEERAIVTNLPGTTRDRIEETINMKGIPLVLIDTAGLRKTGDPVESIGMEKTIEAAKTADLILLVLDASSEFGEGTSEILELIDPSKTLVLMNKIDLGIKYDPRVFEKLSPPIPKERILEISLSERKGLDKLPDKILDMVFGGNVGSTANIIISNARHKDALESCVKHLEEAKKSIARDLPDDFITIDLKAALDALGEIVGKVTSEDLLHRIFGSFCIGK